MNPKAGDEATPLLVLGGAAEYPSQPWEEWKLYAGGDSKLCQKRSCSFPAISLVVAIVVVNSAVFLGQAESAQSVGFCVLVGLLLLAWVQAIITHPGPIPEGWSARVKDLHSHYPGGMTTRFEFNTIRMSWKPVRCHHDRHTERLILNLDHFCPWIGNCVGFCNRKFFVLFLLYTWVSLLYVLVGMNDDYVAKKDDDDWSWLWLTYVSDLLLLVVIFGFWVYHMWLVVTNSTTVEQAARQPTVQFNIGFHANVCQVFGKNPWLWLIPVWGGGPGGNGIEWPVVDGGIKGQLPSVADLVLDVEKATGEDSEAVSEAVGEDAASP